MVFHVNMGNQSHQDKHLPPRATATYQPIKAMTDEEYNQKYIAAIMCNPPASTPAITTPTFQPHPPNPRPHRPAPPLCLPSCAILPTRHHYSLSHNKSPVAKTQTAIKIMTKRVCDPQLKLPVTCSQTRKSAQIIKSINMNKL
ncbi:hypothetical protein DSO57_1012417 [Entomophthora muscae]|uniref:Uncharacterized protein n=1 Tax=Entomophthora muscae TaxID=34485 RepID=A0ACC2UQT3_9FUNG|nr:hypothetical protein DSO57_1012417 [Entomophthora muscae]